MKQNEHSVAPVSGETSLFDPKGNRKYLNAKERLKFYRCAKLLPDSGQRSFCLTLFYTGCRISEALELKPQNIDLSEKSLAFRTLKQRGKERYRALPVPDDLLDEIQQYIEQNPSKKIWVFSRATGWRVIKSVMKQARLDGIKATPKGLRHGFAIACVSNEIPLPTLKKWMGHARLETTGIYLDFVGKDERNLAKRLWKSRSKKGS